MYETVHMYLYIPVYASWSGLQMRGAMNEWPVRNNYCVACCQRGDVTGFRQWRNVHLPKFVSTTMLMHGNEQYGDR